MISGSSISSFSVSSNRQINILTPPPPVPSDNPVETLVSGKYTLTQDVVYALPPVVVRITSDLLLEGSVDGSTWVDITDSDSVGGAFTPAIFVRCSLGDAVVSVKRKYKI